MGGLHDWATDTGPVMIGCVGRTQRIDAARSIEMGGETDGDRVYLMWTSAFLVLVVPAARQKEKHDLAAVHVGLHLSLARKRSSRSTNVAANGGIDAYCV